MHAHSRVLQLIEPGLFPSRIRRPRALKGIGDVSLFNVGAVLISVGAFTEPEKARRTEPKPCFVPQSVALRLGHAPGEADGL